MFVSKGGNLVLEKKHNQGQLVFPEQFTVFSIELQTCAILEASKI